MKIKYICLHDAILKEYLLEIGLSKKFCRKVKLYGKMYCNGQEVKNYFPIKKDDIIELEYFEDENENIVTSKEKIEILYEDSHILVINKRESLASQPSRKHFEDNVISIIKGYYQDKGIISNVHIVNRLDYATSGLMIVAKDGLTHDQLTNGKKGKLIKRKYLAIVEGYLDNKEGTINLPIKRESNIGIKRIVSDEGKLAITKYKVLKEKNNKSLLEIELVTGRTHQIRVHFSYLGHPLVGDKLYGVADIRLFLHCFYLEFINPFNDEKIILEKKDESFEEYF